MKHTTYFHEYLQQRYNEYLHYDQEELAEEVKFLVQSLKPKTGAPFCFFSWFYAKGFKLYKTYFENIPFAYNIGAFSFKFNKGDYSWTFVDEVNNREVITVDEDINALFTEEFDKIRKIFILLSQNSSEIEKLQIYFRAHSSKIKQEINFNAIDTGELNLKLVQEYKQCYSRILDFLDSCEQQYFFPIIVDINGKEKAIKPLLISADQARNLYYLLIIDEGKNESFLKTETGSHEKFHNLLNKPKKYPTEKFYFNCENTYAAFIFLWLETHIHFTDSFSKIEKMGIFYSRRGTKIKQGNLSPALSTLRKSVPNLNEIILSKIEVQDKIPDLKPDSSPTQILEYLHRNLSVIFLS